MARSACLLLFAATLWLAAPALAGPGLRLELEFAERKGGVERVERAIVWIADHRVRIEHVTAGASEERRALIFRADRGILYSVDPADQSYVQIDRRVIDAMDARIKAARKELEIWLDVLPAHQRAAAERLIGAREQEVPVVDTPLIVSVTGQRGKLDGRRCQRVTLHREEVEVGEACVAEWASVTPDPPDLSVLRRLANFHREVMVAHGLTPLETVPLQPLELLAQFDGLPLHLRSLKDGVEKSRVRVLDVESVSAGEELFAAPAGYRLESLLSLMSENHAAPPAARSPESPADSR